MSVCLRVGFGVRVFDLDFWVKVGPVKQPIERDSVGSGNLSHRRTSAYNDHLDYGFNVLESVQQGTLMRRFYVCRNMIDIDQLKILVL